MVVIPRGYIKDLGKYTTPLYNKTSLTGQRKFNSEDVKLVKEIKEKIKYLPELSLPLDSDYLVIECDGCELGWGAILKKKKNKYANIAEEEVCRYASGKYHINPQVYSTSTDYEVNAVINSIKSFELFIINKTEITIRTDCEAIVAYANSQLHSDKKPNQGHEWQTHINTLSTNPVVTTAQTAILNNRRRSLSIRFTDYENTNNSQTDEEEETQPHRNSSAFMNKIIEEDETMTYLC